MLDKSKFVELMANVASMYNLILTEFMFDIYYDIFKDYEYTQFEKAMKEVVKNHKYHTFPKPAEILEFLEGTRDDKALVAWLQVMEAVQKGGYYASIEFADPIIAHCINELGGWTYFCCQPKDETPFLQKRFADLYRLLSKRGVEGNIRLTGFIEAKNREGNYPEAIPETIRIGFKEEIKELEHNPAQKLRER